MGNELPTLRLLIPNADSVIIDTRKFTDYALNPNHDVGRHKA
ncbi:DUF6883 domain-containing protein, partial [Neisseria meningitidis]